MSITKISDTDNFLIKISKFGHSYDCHSVEKVKLVRLDPNTKEVIDEIPLEKILQDLMRLNFDNFAKINDNWRETLGEVCHTK